LILSDIDLLFIVLIQVRNGYSSILW